METGKSVKFGKIMATVIVIISALAAFIVFWVTEEVYIGFLTFLGVAFALLLDFVIADQFGKIAIEKGYSYIYTIWCFIFTMVGYLMVIALPDRGNQNKVIPDELPEL